MINFKTADTILTTGKMPALGFMTCGTIRYLFWREPRQKPTELASFAFFRVTEETEQRIRCGVYTTFKDVLDNQSLAVTASVMSVKLQGLEDPKILQIDSIYATEYDPEVAPEFYESHFHYTEADTIACTHLYPMRNGFNPDHLDAWSCEEFQSEVTEN